MTSSAGGGSFAGRIEQIMAEPTRPAAPAQPQRGEAPTSAQATSSPRQGATDPAQSAAAPPAAAQGYAGDVTPQQACEWWQQGQAVLVDVRTDAEREWVGFIPGAVGLAWKQWPGMAINEDFGESLKAAVPPGKKVVLLCRSGIRSIAAAKRATELGLEAYNILEGFEGDPDEHAQRGRKGGWRMRGLPWRQG